MLVGAQLVAAARRIEYPDDMGAVLWSEDCKLGQLLVILNKKKEVDLLGPATFSSGMDRRQKC